MTQLSRKYPLLEMVNTPEALREDTYAAALIAITADTAEEREFLDELSNALNLDTAERQDIHKQLGM